MASWVEVSVGIGGRVVTEQEMRTKVIKELECCVSLTSNGPKCANCDYADEFHNGDCETYLLSDALALLKAQEPHIVTIADYENNQNVDIVGNLAVWRESRRLNGIAYHSDGWEILNRNRVEGWFNSKMIRFWTSRPTEEQMKAVKWE